MRKIKHRLLWGILTFFFLFSGFSTVLINIGAADTVFHSDIISVSTQDLPIVYPCGFPIGIYLRTDGVMVIGTAKIPDENGNLTEPAAGSLESGDYITAINGEAVNTKEEFQNALNRFGANPVTLTRIRDGQAAELSISPTRGEDGCYRLGIWVKDDTQGIGTMTYLTQDGHFAALGHPISDTDTGKMVQARDGGLYEAQVKMIIKGSNGAPGSYSGIICYDRSTCLGTIEANRENGIFGRISPDKLSSLTLSGPCQVGSKQEAVCGDAILRCTIGQETQDYSIVILNRSAGSRSDNGFLFQVTDQELLDKTGGIIQGMSGSPILQNGKLIGAVTHVFVQDCTRGYGIYLEDMLKQSD